MSHTLIKFSIISVTSRSDLLLFMNQWTKPELLLIFIGANFELFKLAPLWLIYRNPKIGLGPIEPKLRLLPISRPSVFHTIGETSIKSFYQFTKKQAGWIKPSGIWSKRFQVKFHLPNSFPVKIPEMKLAKLFFFQMGTSSRSRQFCC